MFREIKQYPTAPLHASSDSFITGVHMYYGWPIEEKGLKPFHRKIEETIKANPELLPEGIDASEFPNLDKEGIEDFDLAYCMNDVFSKILSKFAGIKIIVHSIHCTGEYVEYPHAAITSIAIVMEELAGPRISPPSKRKIEGTLKKWHSDKVNDIRRKVEEAFGVKLGQPTIFNGEDQVYIESY